MEPILESVIIKTFKNSDFEAINRRAMELMKRVLGDRIEAILLGLKTRALHANRPTITMLDLEEMIESTSSFSARKTSNKTKYFLCDEEINMLKEANMYSKDYIRLYLKTRRMNLFDIPAISPTTSSHEEQEDTIEWNSPLSTKVEKFIHIYDFMPSFPPLHTFRNTVSKQAGAKKHSSQVKNRLEQSLKSEGSMIKLIKNTGSLPPYVNYLYQDLIKKK
ncbi:hypothetical protein ENBRE01_0828 [Enteropsectra breve]|nr:hypothetical protein ENBRE01_0828 [Enteropsectra breve]